MGGALGAVGRESGGQRMYLAQSRLARRRGPWRWLPVRRPSTRCRRRAYSGIRVAIRFSERQATARLSLVAEPRTASESASAAASASATPTRVSIVAATSRANAWVRSSACAPRFVAVQQRLRAGQEREDQRDGAAQAEEKPRAEGLESHGGVLDCCRLCGVRWGPTSSGSVLHEQGADRPAAPFSETYRPQLGQHEWNALGLHVFETKKTPAPGRARAAQIMG